jgi:hypothetical protein
MLKLLAENSSGKKMSRGLSSKKQVVVAQGPAVKCHDMAAME